MDILIIGGTRFLGRALVTSALASGHTLTLFNRGVSNPELFPTVEHLTGDRAASLDALDGRRWDAVIDTCGYEPAIVRRSAEKLANVVSRYIFISSISVYASLSQPGGDEEAPLARLPEGADETFHIEHYGALKALCEQAVERTLLGRTLNIRPGLIVGEYDPTDRFTYWPWRVSRGGDILAPDGPGYPIQIIDVRDLADWTLRMVETAQTGVYNATGPQQPLTLGRLLEVSQRASGSDARVTWVSEQFLLENGVEPWSDLPLWIPASDRESAGMNQVSIDRALQAGLRFRPLEDTVASTLDWAARFPAGHQWKAGLPAEREAALLRKFRDAASGYNQNNQP